MYPVPGQKKDQGMSSSRFPPARTKEEGEFFILSLCLCVSWFALANDRLKNQALANDRLKNQALANDRLKMQAPANDRLKIQAPANKRFRSMIFPVSPMKKEPERIPTPLSLSGTQGLILYAKISPVRQFPTMTLILQVLPLPSLAFTVIVAVPFFVPE